MENYKSLEDLEKMEPLKRLEWLARNDWVNEITDIVSEVYLMEKNALPLKELNLPKTVDERYEDLKKSLGIEDTKESSLITRLNEFIEKLKEEILGFNQLLKTNPEEAKDHLSKISSLTKEITQYLELK